MRFFCSEPDTTTIQIFTDVPPGLHQLVAATSKSELVVLNASTGTKVRQVSCPSLISHLVATSNTVISGSADGYVRLHDIRTTLKSSGGADHAAKAHQGGVQGIACSGNWVYSIGWGQRYDKHFLLCLHINYF